MKKPIAKGGKSNMKYTWIIAFLFLTGCGFLGFKADQFTAQTKAAANKDGFSYESGKNQESLDASGEIDPKTGKMTFKVKTTSSTPEAAIAAALQANAQAMQVLSEIMKEIIPIAKAAASKGAVP